MGSIRSGADCSRSAVSSTLRLSANHATIGADRFLDTTGCGYFREGPAHPAHAVFADLTFWAEVDEDGHVPFAQVYESSDQRTPSHREAELFTTERKARSFHKQIEEEPTRIATVSRTRVLDEIGHADIVWVDNRHALLQRGPQRDPPGGAVVIHPAA